MLPNLTSCSPTVATGVDVGDVDAVGAGGDADALGDGVGTVGTVDGVDAVAGVDAVDGAAETTGATAACVVDLHALKPKDATAARVNATTMVGR